MVLKFAPLRDEQSKQRHHDQNQWEKSEQAIVRELGSSPKDVILNDLIENVMNQLRKGQTSQVPWDLISFAAEVRVLVIYTTGICFPPAF